MPGMCDVRHPRTRHFPFNLSAYHIIACSRQTSPLQLFNSSTLQLFNSSTLQLFNSSTLQLSYLSGKHFAMLLTDMLHDFFVTLLVG